MFEYPLVSRPIYNENQEIQKYELLDGEIVNVLQEQLNFTAKYTNIGDSKWGVQLPNGSFTGGLYCVENDLVDLLANTIAISNMNTTNSLFLRTITRGRFYFIVPTPEIVKELLVSLYNSIDNATLIMELICFMLFPVFLVGILKTESNIFQTQRKISFVKSVLSTIGIIFNVSVQHPLNHSSRILFACIVIYSIIHSSVLQSTIITNLNTNIEIGRIHKLNDLLDNNYELSINEKSYGILKTGDGNRMLRKLKQMAENSAVRSSKNLTGKIIAMNNTAVLVTDMFSKNYLDRFYDNFTKKNSFYRVPEYVIQFYTSVMTPKNSPFQDVFSDILKIFVESGLAEFQLQLSNMENEKVMIQRVINGEIPAKEDKTITLSNISSIFFIYLTLNGFAIMVFIIELLSQYLNIEKIKRNCIYIFKKHIRVK